MIRPRDPQTIALLIFAAFVALVGFVAASRVLATDDVVAASILENEGVQVGSVSVEGTVRVQVPEGALPDEIVSALSRAGVVEDAETLRALLYFTGAGPQLSAGEYEFALRTPPSEVIRRLRSGPDLIERITFRSGLRVEEIGEILEENDYFTAAEWDAAVQAAPRREFMGDVSDFLGFLLPDTYEIEADTTAASLLEMMLDRFEEQVTPTLIARAESQGWSLYEVLTIASVVEREGVHDDEKPAIAATFLNRLDEGVPLQADATVQFAVTLQPDAEESIAEHTWWKRGLTIADLELDSPYNTYYYAGLMPGPIANPDIQSIRAVIDRAPFDYVYFVAHPDCDGRHLFATTLDEHNANVELFRASECAEGITD